MQGKSNDRKPPEQRKLDAATLTRMYAENLLEEVRQGEPAARNAFASTEIQRTQSIGGGNRAVRRLRKPTGRSVSTTTEAPQQPRESAPAATSTLPLCG